MNFQRIIVMDLASFGIGAAADAATYSSTKADTLGHLDQQHLLNIPTLKRLGLGNIRNDNPLKMLQPMEKPQGFFGQLSPTVNNLHPEAGLREMFDFDEPLRTLSSFNHLARRNIDVRLITPYISYFANQDQCRLLPTFNDDQGWEDLMGQLSKMTSGLIYLRETDLPLLAHKNQLIDYAAKLSIIDKQIGILMDKLTSSDLLIVTSSFADDPTFTKQPMTRENLPVILYTPQFKTGHSLGIRRSAGDLAVTLVDNFHEPNTRMKFPNSLLWNLDA